MGRRSRQRARTPQRARTTTPTPPPAPDETPSAAPLTTAARRSRRDQAPKPPWGSFPLVELSALAAIVLGVAGILSAGHTRAVLWMIAMLLGSVAGLEVAIREHFGGYRSHTLVLSGVLAFAILVLLYLAGAQRTLLIVGVAAGILIGIPTFRQLFKRRSGGVGMKVR